MEEAIAAFCVRTGQEAPKGRGAFLRTVYEGLALKYRSVNEEISRACGKTTRVVHIVGGGSRNDLLNQFTADATGYTVVAGPDEATAAGNCMVQALGLGIIGNLEETLPIIRRGFRIKEFYPRDRSPWERAYANFVGIVERAKRT
jgi:sugar (pentulose or hexulose) kinase